jgi:hypothetical protein
LLAPHPIGANGKKENYAEIILLQINLLFKRPKTKNKMSPGALGIDINIDGEPIASRSHTPYTLKPLSFSPRPSP